MGNPHPTKSKPCKIGRKHTQQPSEKRKAKKRRGQEIYQQRVAAAKRRKLAAARKYWAGESDNLPEK